MTALFWNSLGPHGTDRAELVTVAGRSLSSAALAEATGAMAASLRGADVVAVDTRSGLETVVAVLGALAAGSVAVPVPGDSGPASPGTGTTTAPAANAP
ncbi:MAG: hypothetical protein M3137_00045, partial [Actinomycetota bacterium]|nr:hypothetical protein [Actinomycetota bacterium]